MDTWSHNASIGRWGKWGVELRITKEMIGAFALLTENHQWIHEDAARCVAESPYGAVIAHGLLLVSLVPALLPADEHVPAGHSVRIIRGMDRLRLISPVYPEDRVRMRTSHLVTQVAQSGKGLIVTRRVEVWRVGGERPALVCDLHLQYF